MGGRNSRPKPKIPISIPSFPFPSFIYDYLMANSGGFIISFSETFENIKGSQYVEGFQGFQGFQGLTNNSETQPIPAYLTTQAPTPAPINSENTVFKEWSRRDTNKAVFLPNAIPPFWNAAIRSMEYLTILGPIDTNDVLLQLYREVSIKMKEYIGDGSNSQGNVAALIYFCTVVTVSFEPYRNILLYNRLKETHSKIFTNPMIYQKFIMVNTFCNKMRYFLERNNSIPGSYMSVNDRAAKFSLPDILNFIITILSDSNPLDNGIL
jgi:hypothetical protein